MMGSNTTIMTNQPTSYLGCSIMLSLISSLYVTLLKYHWCKKQIIGYKGGCWWNDSSICWWNRLRCLWMLQDWCQEFPTNNATQTISGIF